MVGFLDKLTTYFMGPSVEGQKGMDLMDMIGQSLGIGVLAIMVFATLYFTVWLLAHWVETLWI